MHQSYAALEKTASELAVLLDGNVSGNPDVRVRKLAKIESAGPGSVTFLSNPEYERFLYDSEASVVVVGKDFQPAQPIPKDMTLLRVDDAYQAFARLLEAHDAVNKRAEGVHPSATIDASASIGEGCFVGPGVVVEAGAVVGRGVELHAHAYVGQEARIGNDCLLHAGAKVLDRCVLGNQCTLQAGAVVGSDGFGFAPREDGSYVKVPQTGNVVLEDGCDVGALTTIDRATMGSTLLKRGCKLDNLIQVAHNVVIGEATVIAAQTGTGSTTIGALHDWRTGRHRGTSNRRPFAHCAKLASAQASSKKASRTKATQPCRAPAIPRALRAGGMPLTERQGHRTSPSRKAVPKAQLGDSWTDGLRA